MIELFVMILAFVGVTIDECPTDEVVLTSVCHWDAAERGNGHGSSFLSTQDAFVNDAMIVDAYEAYENTQDREGENADEWN